MTTVVSWFLSELGELALEEGAKGLWNKIADRRARGSLARACASAIEAAAAVAPTLGEDLRSESFCDGAILPLVRSLLETPSTLVTAEKLASHYVDMFVERFSGTSGVDATLVRIFQTDRAQLIRAFEAFLEALTAALYASKYWREAQHYRTTEAISTKIDRVITLLEERDADARAAKVDVDQAMLDAATASAELRAWPSEIHGVRLETPALERLIKRLVDEPSGRTLLVGEAGTGKSALLARLAEALEGHGITVFAIKADLLPATLATLDDLAQALGVGEGLEDRIAALAAERPVALLLDQLDAVSDVMDRQSGRMRLLLQLVHRLGARARAGDAPLRVHVLVSSRPFEAAHDARFQQLKAEMVRLDLLSDSQVATLLAHLGLEPDDVDSTLRQTLRRPFALKLFADIVARGGDSRDITPAGLLDAWLATADLGGAADRQAVGVFLTDLAEEMVATETLWRPADAFDLAHAGAVQRAEAAGLVIRSGTSLGFSHQSWLDDFQAKAFRTGRDLAAYVWDRQDSLFIRASIFRGLERLRIRDSRGYEAALNALLGTKRTRRHILHLIADIIATANDPLSFETGWVDHWIRYDTPLALRALHQIVPHWEAWRDGLRHVLPTLMTMDAFHWQAARLLAAEVRFDSDHVAHLLDRFWNDPAKDHLVFEILELSDFVGLEVQARLRTIFSRTTIDEYAVSHLVTTLRADARFEEAAEIVALWLEFQEVGRHAHPKLYELEKLAESAPLPLARKLLPWFVAIASCDVDPEHDIVADFPRSRALPYGWGIERDRGSPFEALHKAIELLGSSDPTALWSLLAPIASLKIDQIQELIAVGLAAAGPALAHEALDFLLADTRRFRISHIMADVDDGVIGSIHGWHSHQLVRAIVPGLNDSRLTALRDAIEAWSSYTGSATQDEDTTLTDRRLQWADEDRFPLLEALPTRLLDADRLSQIAEWRSRQRTINARPGEAGLATWVGPAMTHEEMAAASDADVFAMLDELHDGSSEDRWTRPLSRGGGVREIARAFGAFGKADPARGIAFAARLLPGRHERAAGALVRELGGADGADPAEVLALVLDLDARGFSSPDWRQDAANALQEVARRLAGLEDAVIALMESWIETDAARISAQIADRLAFEARNPRDRGSPDEPWPILFGAGGGVEVLPNDNFTILSAMGAGLLCRKSPDSEAWAGVLERHLDRPEDPAIWGALLLWRGESLVRAESARVSRLLERLQEVHPATYLDARLTRFLWRLRDRISDGVLVGAMIAWMGSGDPTLEQAAGEFLTGAHLVDPDTIRYRLLFDRLDRSRASIETGVLFSAAAAWRERDPTLRPSAHALLLAALATAAGPAAHALSRAVDSRPDLIPDALTKALLAALPSYPAVLKASLDHYFANALQGLLLYPGFDEVVLSVVERMTDFVTEPGARRQGLLGQDLVHVAIALQRSDGPLRGPAMDLYERLLDAAVYGAEEAAKASLSR